jgi:hypothetical protein
MPLPEEDNGSSLQRRRARSPSPPSVALRTRAATPEEEQRLLYAIDLLLAEFVRQRLHIDKEKEHVQR